MARFFLIFGSLFLLSACVDMTGISTTSTRPLHPRSNPSAAVLVEEFADLQCPACKAAHTTILEPLLQSHGSDIRYTFRHFPLVSIHRNALAGAQGAECAADQGKFWEFADLDYSEQEKLAKSGEVVYEWAETLALDGELFRRCMKSGTKKDLALADYDEGRERGVKGTPTFFVNGERVESELPKIQAAIDAELQTLRQRL